MVKNERFLSEDSGRYSLDVGEYLSGPALRTQIEWTLRTSQCNHSYQPGRMVRCSFSDQIW